MGAFICPVCGNEIIKNNNCYKCENNHSFDISKFGYVNLLMSQKSSKKRHGDDKQMIIARRDFLEKGYYEPLKNKVCEIIDKYKKPYTVLLDTGCGECYYTEGFHNELNNNGEIYGIDISKEALRYANKRLMSSQLAVASIFSLPIKDNSVDILVNMFAPHCEGEYKRVLKDDGVMIRVFPLENHLIDLKSKIYENVYKNKIDTYEAEGFELISKQELKYDIHLDNQNDIDNLFKMTPYYYKTSVADQQKVAKLTALDTKVEFIIEVFKK